MNKLVKYSGNLPEPSKAYQDFKMVKSMTDARTFDCTTIGQIRKNEGEKPAVEYVSKWIIDLNNFINVSRRMNGYQIVQTAEMILSDYYFLKLSDIYFFFSEMKKGRYCKFYDSIDGSMIMAWMERYVNDRSNQAFEESLNKHYELKPSRA